MLSNNANVVKRIDDIYKQLSINDKPINQKYIADPVLWAEECFDIELDPWQIEALQSTSHRSLWNIHRQGGKSSIAALKGVHRAIFKPGALVLLVSPSLRQSSELFRKCMNRYEELDNVPDLAENTKLSAELENGSRIVSLPGSESTVRGYSGPSLIIEDEASRVSDEYFHALTPMMAVSEGDFLLLSTPFGCRGHFHAIATDPDNDWLKITIPVTDCPRISAEFLEAERKMMSDAFFRSEFMCEFVDSAGGCFTYDQVSSAFSSDIEPLELAEVEEW